MVTRNQAVFPLWFELCKGRITASKAHSVVHRRDFGLPQGIMGPLILHLYVADLQSQVSPEEVSETSYPSKTSKS